MSRHFSRLVAAALAMSLVAAACGEDSSSGTTAATEPPQVPTESSQAPPPVVSVPVVGSVVEVAVESGSFPTLVAAVEAAGLVETLSGEGPFTVFAPTEEAFAVLLEALGLSAGELLADTELLVAVLTYHVLPVETPSGVVVTLDGESVGTVNGAEVAVSVDGGVVRVNDATVVTADIEASNGVIPCDRQSAAPARRRVGHRLSLRSGPANPPPGLAAADTPYAPAPCPFFPSLRTFPELSYTSNMPVPQSESIHSMEKAFARGEERGAAVRVPALREVGLHLLPPDA